MISLPSVSVNAFSLLFLLSSPSEVSILFLNLALSSRPTTQTAHVICKREIEVPWLTTSTFKTKCISPFVLSPSGSLTSSHKPQILSSQEGCNDSTPSPGLCVTFEGHLVDMFFL